jgi:hypothetical protein
MPELIDSPIQLEESNLEGYGGFHSALYLINVTGDKFAANCATLQDGQTVNGLATFPDPDEATTYMGLLAGLSGDIVKKSFDEAREIAISKPALSCLFLFVGGQIADVHWIR